MLPGVEPDDDVMNTPCPDCNEWSKETLYRVEYTAGGNCWLIWKRHMTLGAARSLAASIETRDTRIIPEQNDKMEQPTLTNDDGI